MSSEMDRIREVFKEFMRRSDMVDGNHDGRIGQQHAINTAVRMLAKVEDHDPVATRLLSDIIITLNQPELHTFDRITEAGVDRAQSPAELLRQLRTVIAHGTPAEGETASPGTTPSRLAVSVEAART